MRVLSPSAGMWKACTRPLTRTASCTRILWGQGSDDGMGGMPCRRSNQKVWLQEKILGRTP